MSKRSVSFTLNGKPVSLEVEPRTTLLRALRDHGVTSVKRGCEEGECGTCTVLALEAEGRSVVTTEGLVGPKGQLHPVQQAFIDEGAIQCGFCTPGMILSVVDLLRRHPEPTEEQIRVGLSGNLCRCTGYEGIFRAVRKAAALMKESAQGGRS